jgi:hypothetical protein
MMRRIDARISSIEGSWTFAGCVISDSRSSTPRIHCFIPGTAGLTGSRCERRRFSSSSPHLSPDQVPLAAAEARDSPLLIAEQSDEAES